MKKILYFFPVILFSLATLAQKTIPDFGKIDIADLQSRSCAFEPDADAMKLFDVEKKEWEATLFDYRSSTEKHVRIKVFNEKGYPSATINIPYYGKKRQTKIKGLEGYVYNLDAAGNIVAKKLTEDDFFNKKIIENLNVISFAFPDVKPGSVIEYRYSIVEKDAGQFDTWIAQDIIPVAYTSKEITVPSISRVYEKILGGDTILQLTDTDRKISGKKRIIYYKENLGSFRPEPFMSSTKDNLLKMMFLFSPRAIFITPATIWQTGGRMLMNAPTFGFQLRVVIPGTEKIVDSAKAIPGIDGKIGFLFEHVRQKFPNKKEQATIPGDLIDAWNTGIGNSADVNMILVNLLQMTGLKASPLMVSTRDNGTIDLNFPNFGQFNGLDAVVFDGDKSYILDASQKYQSPFNPPLNVLNRDAFLLGDGNAWMQWVKIRDDRTLVKQAINIQAGFLADGTITGTAYTLYYDYAKSYALDSAIRETAEDKFFDKKSQGLKIISVKQKDGNDINKPLSQETSFTYEPQHTGDFYFINPQFFSGNTENPFIKEDRNTDIDLGCNQQFTLKINIDIPEGFETDHLPKNILVRAADSSFIFSRRIIYENNSIFYEQNFEILQPIFVRGSYNGVRDFFKQMYALMSEEIVLKKKK